MGPDAGMIIAGRKNTSMVRVADTSTKKKQKRSTYMGPAADMIIMRRGTSTDRVAVTPPMGSPGMCTTKAAASIRTPISFSTFS